MSKMKQAALAYAKKGWPIFPCRSDKTPYTVNGVNDATTDPIIIEAWYDKWPMANIGLNVGEANMAVLDFDPGSSMEELEKNVGPIPISGLVARTPRGGKHIYLGLAADEVVAPSQSKLAPHIDVRSFHSYVLLPPSKTADGEYTWESEGKPAYRTDEMLRMCNTGREKSSDRDNWIIEPDLPENIRDAVDWLKNKAQIAIDGQGGDGMAYATAAACKSFGLSEEMAFDVMWEHWNPRCSPPWDSENADHLREKLKNGYSYNTSPPGSYTQAYSTANTLSMFKPVVADPDDPGKGYNAGRFRFVSRERMQNIRPPAWLINGLLPAQAYAILYGAPGTFKTFLALDIALSVAAGMGMSDTANWPDIEEAGPVLYCAGEGRSSITKRVKAWENTNFYGNRVEDFNLVDPVPLVSEDIGVFIEGAKQLSPNGYKLIVIDTVGRSMQGMNENSQEHASAFTQKIEHLQKELGAAVLALHHTGKGDTNSARGSSVFGADADVMLKLERQNKSYTVSLAMTKQKDAPEWEDKQYIQLNEVSVGIEDVSLVAVKGEKLEQELSKERQVTKKKMDIVEAIALRHLFNNKDLACSMKILSEVVFRRDLEGFPKAQQIAKLYISTLRDNSKSLLSKCYSESAKSEAAWKWNNIKKAPKNLEAFLIDYPKY